MEWLICGTVPDKDFLLSQGQWRLDEHRLVPADGSAQGNTLDVRRGTPALIAASLLVCGRLGTEPPKVLLAGDTGDGTGSAVLYRHLTEFLSAEEKARPEGITFHYLYPDVDWHNRILMALDERVLRASRPLLVADAGFMYVAKMSGYADRYDLFTPDAGELAFLADEKAPHPFYTRGFLLDEERDVDELVRRAQAHGNCARTLLIKGVEDCVASEGVILERIVEPCVPYMEPIGGTGDLVTGIVTGLLASGFPLRRACVIAARTNRLAGKLASPTPATQVAALLPYLQDALQLALDAEIR